MSTLMETKNNTGEKADLETISKEFGPLISAICSRMISDRELARDTAQEVWFEIVKSYPGFAGKSKLSTWIYRIAKRTVYKHIHKEKTYSTRFLSSLFRSKTSEGLEEMEAIPFEDRTFWIKDQCNMCLTGIMHCLNNEARLLFVLRYIADLSYDQLELIFEKPQSTIRKAISRSTLKINRFLNGQCYLYNPGGSCSCKIKKPIRAIDTEGEFKKLRKVYHKGHFIKAASNFIPQKNFWENLLTEE